MTALFQQRHHEAGRPDGITWIAVALLAYALTATGYAALIATGRIALSCGAWVVEGGLETLGAGVFVIYAAAYSLCGVGLLRMNRWALRLTSLLLVYGVVQVTPAISSAVGDGRLIAIAREGAQILARSAALWYLWQEPTRDAFQKAPPLL